MTQPNTPSSAIAKSAARLKATQTATRDIADRLAAEAEARERAEGAATRGEQS